ncbi:prepilin-type N-terminal cleavage/methylation domain-containing protein [Bremerella sp. JC817]|uniref:prepilin-type N-terminal cleavage/methylation domain-containing protein n=1 Tax=Bremerella sp. JC817 TaxID=3231756 RepID=UPI00345AE018
MVPSQTLTKCGFSLLELLVAMSLLVSAVTAVSVLMRVNYDTWIDHRSDSLRHEAAVGVLRHMVRQIRQCQEVSAISAAGDSSGSLTLLMPNGSSVIWDHAGTNVYFGTTTADQLLGNHIAALSLVGYEQDGITQTTDPSAVQCIRITVTYALPQRSMASRSLKAHAWVRAF